MLKPGMHRREEVADADVRGHDGGLEHQRNDDLLECAAKHDAAPVDGGIREEVPLEDVLETEVDGIEHADDRQDGGAADAEEGDDGGHGERLWERLPEPNTSVLRRPRSVLNIQQMMG